MIGFVVVAHNMVEGVVHGNTSSILFIQDFVEFFLDSIGFILELRIVEFECVVVLCAEFSKFLVEVYIRGIFELHSRDFRVERRGMFVRSTFRINKKIPASLRTTFLGRFVNNLAYNTFFVHCRCNVRSSMRVNVLESFEVRNTNI
jgi:hypothetical protein